MKNSCTWANSFWKKGNCGSGSESHISRSQNYKGGHIGPRFPNFQANFFSHYNRKLQNFQSWKDLYDDLIQFQYLMEKIEANKNPQMSCPGEYLKLAHSRALANVCSHRLGALDILLVSPTWLFRAEAPKSQSVDWWRAINARITSGMFKNNNSRVPFFEDSVSVGLRWSPTNLYS